MLMPSIFGEGFFDDFFNTPSQPSLKVGHVVQGIMKTDIRETPSAYELLIELPGCSREDVKAELKDGYMIITAKTKSDDTEDGKSRYIRRERYYGTASRSFYVGDDVTESDISAAFENGILKVTVPKKQPEPKVERSHFIPID